MTAPKQVDFVDGTTIVAADFLDRIQEIQAGLAINAALAISGTNVVLNAGTGNDVCSMTIDERFRYIEAPQTVSFSGSDSAGSYSIWATTTNTDSSPGFTVVKTAGTTPPTADNYRRIGSVDWNGSTTLSNLRQLAGYDAHGHMHTAGADPLPAGSITTTQIADGTIVLADLASSLQQLLVPTGTVMPYAGASAPSAFLLCDGSAVSRTTYADLYTALGGAASPYGQGDGTTTFNVPDLRGRVIAGKDNMGGTAASRLSNIITGSTLGASGGVERHSLIAAESGMPSHSVNADGGHSHNVSLNGSHSHGGGTFGAGGHSHSYSAPLTGKSIRQGTGTFTGAMEAQIDGGGTSGVGDHAHGIGADGNHAHTVDGGSHTHSVNAVNASSPHTNVQPTLVLNYIIKV